MKRTAYMYAWLISLAWALLDEWHQSFVPERTASFADVCLDSSGAALGII
ncbi:VanZ family protein [Marinicrinis lubricantis]|uniref:VanZ family protein n=1 Tax=Marinicrinis lubricantis TaxID=2086470 RepID=A0ABW1IJU9_9BACL